MNNTTVTAFRTNRRLPSRFFAAPEWDYQGLLKIYNVISGRKFKNPDILEVRMRENGIYMAVRNDISMIINFRERRKWLVSGDVKVPLQFPVCITGAEDASGKQRKRSALQYMVFYNGELGQPERHMLVATDEYSERKYSAFAEVRAVLLNINEGDNRRLLQSCLLLREHVAGIPRRVRTRKR